MVRQALQYEQRGQGLPAIPSHPMTVSYANLTALHLDDTVTTCDCCGRQNLKATVLMRNSDTGAEFYFGRTCAARNSGKSSQQITKEVRAARDAAHGRTMNHLADLRRSGVVITRQMMREVAATYRADVVNLMRNWGHLAAA
jgi:hypothetical protein